MGAGMILLMLSPFEISEGQLWTAFLSGAMGFAGLILHNLIKSLTDEGVEFAIQLPRIENGKLKLGGTIANVTLAFLVGVLLFNPIAAFFAGYAGANALKDMLLVYERRAVGSG